MPKITRFQSRTMAPILPVNIFAPTDNLADKSFNRWQCDLPLVVPVKGCLRHRKWLNDNKIKKRETVDISVIA